MRCGYPGVDEATRQIYPACKPTRAIVLKQNAVALILLMKRKSEGFLDPIWLCKVRVNQVCQTAQTLKCSH
ncbi:uncharacterized protein PHALS_15119 [Plasmopara halstedii]|uniref:Uncharacterized protein n=1 Tax=Plasmopara halstedii TaxID=4781 RepID=A0A0P1AAT7_PLAHL|nr:uncharacterized protein PHALS_15119 [Plasmopara halstedii]CEG37831.1 hypothetical protein PHALS_15119 [Plasmopara halstedii]|eukprot:XP_024574200.1 hypothetical protein PHALS_15119 [Plasmopara halstedii]